METNLHAAGSCGDEIPCSVGEQLRKAREQKSISLEEAAESTKIGKQYLKALESGAYEQLPGPAYLHGFLRTYAVYLGLPAEGLIRQADCGSRLQSLTGEPVPNSLKGHRFRWELLLLPMALLSALLVSTLFQVDYFTPPHRTLQPPVDPTPVQTVGLAAVQQPISSSVVAPSVQPSPHVSEKPEVASEPIDVGTQLSGVLVRMRVKRDSTVFISIDDAASQGYELLGGDLIEWKAQRTIAIDFSDQGSVEIELNGKPLKLHEAPGKSAYLVLDAQGVRR